MSSSTILLSKTKPETEPKITEKETKNKKIEKENVAETGKNLESDKNVKDKVTEKEKTITERSSEGTILTISIDMNQKLPAEVQERFQAIKKKVLDAIAAHHTFMIYGKARVVRECMIQRGWCEKFYRKSVDPHLNVETNPLILLHGMGDLKDPQNERLLISKMLSNHTVDFLWNTGVDWQGWPSQKNKTTVFNRYCRAPFTSKIGLCANVRQMMWYYEPGVSHTLFPRCYNLCQNDQMDSFVDDFRLTACMSLLKWLVDKVNTDGESATRSTTGTVPAKAIEFAIKRCMDYIKSQSHEDIDQEVEKVWTHQWDQFVAWYYKIIHGQSLFVSGGITFHKYYLTASQILKRIKKFWQQLEMDGMLNIWIVKPGNKSRGRGIVLMNRLEDVLNKVNPSNKTDSRYVVQKYIERPFLIYDTKFDIRQWFLITRTFPLTIWMYKESYLRFCTKKFSLKDFHESIHLCNNSIQCKYTNDPNRDSALPSDNMWDATTFKEFLKNQGHGNVWEELIYPGMRQGLIGSLLSSQEAMDQRKNSFELYGADFMVMEDFSIWLIEINSHPDMSYSTSVTTRLCRQVMEDTVKVVVDLRENKNVDTGQFELVYKQRVSSCQPYLGSTLSIQGTRLSACDRKLSFDTKFSQSFKTPSITQKKPSMARYHIGPVIVDLIEELEMQLDQDMTTYFNTETTKLKASLPSEILPEIRKERQLLDIDTETLPILQPEPTPPIVTPKIKTSTIQKSKASDERILSRPISRRILRIKNNNNKIIINNNNNNNNSGSRDVLKVAADITKIQQNLYRRMADFAKNSTKVKSLSANTGHSLQSVKKELSDKKNSVASTVKEVIIQYNRNASVPVNASPKRTLPTPIVEKTSSGVLKKKKIRKIHKKRTSKKSSTVTDIFAVGLSLKK